MANQKTRVKYNPKTKNLPGTNMVVLARALHLIARREARMREQPESQPCGLTFSSSTNLWLQSGITSSTFSTTSKENTSSKSSYSIRSSNSCTRAPTSDRAEKSKKHKASPSICQREVAGQERARQQRTTPQDSADTPHPRSTATYSRSPSPTATMTPAEAKELISTAVGTQRRHEVYHGTTLVSDDPLFRQIWKGGIFGTEKHQLHLTNGSAQPEEELELPIIATRRSNASFPDDDPARYYAKSTDFTQSSKRRKTNGLTAYPVSPSDDERPVVRSFPNIFLSKTQLAAEKQDCHYCQLEAFSTHSDYPVTIENKMLDDATLPHDFRFIERPHFGTGVARCDANFRAGCDCSKASACGGQRCECHNPDQGEMPYEVKGPKKGCLKRKFFRSILAIFECHDSCLNCINKDCPNRIVDNGRKIPLTIFRTTDGRGWGKVHHKTPITLRTSYSHRLRS